VALQERKKDGGGPRVSGGEVFGIEPSDTGKGLGVDLVALGVVGLDEADFAGVGDQDLVTACSTRRLTQGE